MNFIVIQKLGVRMKCILSLVFCSMLTLQQSTAQQQDVKDSLYIQFKAEQEKINQSFSEYYFSHRTKIYSLDEHDFISTMDSLRDIFTDQLRGFESKHPGHDKSILRRESKDIRYSFDKFLLEYPYYHEMYTAERPFPLELIDERLQENYKDFNDPGLLPLDGFKTYLKTFLYFRSQDELNNGAYRSTDNQQLRATLHLIPKYISNKLVVEYLEFEYIYDHIDRYGIKNLEAICQNFLAACRDSSRVNKIKELYAQEAAGREGHLIKIYKTVDGCDLEIHLFLPEKVDRNRKRPAIIYFSGGSWSEGKPDWNFSACQSYAKKGWVGVAVEFRLAYRQGSLPFEAVMDAKSAIRWLREHAHEYNIDTNRMVAAGNSAGGHLVLATALADKWNEKTDDLNYSSVPNVVMVTSGVFDLTDENFYWIKQGLKKRNLPENLLEEISPNFLVKKGMPPTLIIHGTNDSNVPFGTAEQFANMMTQVGNKIEFHPLEGAGHFLWYGPRSNQVSALRKSFLEKLGYGNSSN